MRIKIIPPAGCSREQLDDRGWTELPEGSTVSDALRVIRCGKLKAKILLCSRNGERTDFGTVLQDGDVIGFFSPITGG